MPDLLPGAEGFPKTAKLTDKVHRVLGLNPSAFTGPGTNTYLVGMDGSEPLIIDTGSGLTEYRKLLQGYMQEVGAPALQRILLTHIHGDHIGGAADVRRLYGDLPVFKHPWPGKDEAYDLPLHNLNDGDVIEGDGYTLRAYHTPGHAKDHICYYLEEEKALFTGDVILGVGTTVIPADGGNLGEYLDTLRRLQTLDLAKIYPGHGPVIDKATEKVTEYLEHRLERERQIVGQLEGGPKTVPEMVAEIYKEYPVHLHQAAGHSVMAHVDKLIQDGRVSNQGGSPPHFRLEA